MVSIVKHQQLIDNEDLKVLSESGEYDECDLIQCYRENEEPFCMFEARYIVYGSSVYKG